METNFSKGDANLGEQPRLRKPPHHQHQPDAPAGGDQLLYAMPFSAKDLQRYRKDERFSHRLMTPEERVNLLKPYLPSPPPRDGARRASLSQVSKEERKGKLGVRRFLRRHFHIFVYALIHFYFSIYIRLRQAYHAIGNRFYTVYHHHHHSPELIQRDIKDLGRLPKHLSVILTLEDQGRSGAGLEKLVNEAADIAAWCASAGIDQLSIYERTGILKGYVKETHQTISHRLQTYFGPSFPSVSLGAPHVPPIQSGLLSLSNSPNNESRKTISILLISAEDGRDSIVDLTKTLAEMSQRKKLQAADITTELVDAELSESIMEEPDLLVLFSPHVELAGYPPWQIRLTEIFHVPDNQGVGYQVFYRAMCRFSKAQMRMGR
ncbi:putative undecaprenyl pyrophosphate synthetase [Triangularia verruculosa]|uniref:ditrans,polycis-polyprenyl diphosphate synthase [(2E,6E)-farnesyldiphosphate specific] n=1 Tax=Triangularia verruculosa TaxID=2587418 RepID=A0AAN7AQ37_9PEZI|nr:putative undecaprenyl pyrophosphate synthetase [Triangularia verruculosa]